MMLAACGDALGAPFEGRAPADRAEIDDWINQSTQPVRFTDDTTSTLVVADHLTRRWGIVNEDELADELAREWARDPERGYGHGAAHHRRCGRAGRPRLSPADAALPLTEPTAKRRAAWHGRHGPDDAMRSAWTSTT
ncbi:hypothetical protein GCM10009541_29530 [Micromonospora gifhornensis]|uniref:ADP-ribosylglycohydrolase n=1 Tax=Micromonospora gifhornensis TaxID=84594 RepID=A0ABQ4I8E2_9ACTN|nr:ADP-ribosylglycohydrolase family protein [Micromonospora gifhornensis]GIJ14186.1 hypothetical protein Vgi01_08700 [Micromonospora gifhornensis]